jgi:hypothetical protein
MVNQVFHRIVDILNQNVKFPETGEEAMGRDQVRLDNHPRVRFIVDATNMKIQKPKRDAGIYRDRKKGYSMKVQITINAAGRAVHVSKVYPGSVHDFRVFKEVGIGAIPEEATTRSWAIKVIWASTSIFPRRLFRRGNRLVQNSPRLRDWKTIQSDMIANF